MTRAKSTRIAAIAAAAFAIAAFWRADAAAQSPDAAAALPRVTATLAGPPVSMYSWGRDNCEPADFPDAPARAFRDAAGTMHFFVAGHEGYASLGPDLAHLRHDCHPVLHSVNSKDPARFADSTWLTSFYTADGRTVYSLVHNEFHGWERASANLCPSHLSRNCSYVSLLAATSANGGQTFAVEPPPRGVVVTSPYRYQPDAGVIGFMNPSNIIKSGGYYYVAFNARPFREQREGICLMRTQALDDPASWRAWDGHGFTIAFADPYVATGIVPARSTCKPVGPEVRMGGPSLVQDLPDGVFIMIGQRNAPVRHRVKTLFQTPAVSVSRNLIDWSPTEPLLSPQDEERLGSANYPTLFDPASTDRNFATTGDAPELIYVHFNDGKSVADRDVLRVPLRLRVVALGKAP
jgi:hypothetical protein